MFSIEKKALGDFWPDLEGANGKCFDTAVNANIYTSSFDREIACIRSRWKINWYVQPMNRSTDSVCLFNANPP